MAQFGNRITTYSGALRCDVDRTGEPRHGGDEL